MCVCTFFGHRDCPNTIKPLMREVIIDLIENQNVDTFYIGQQGSFDFSLAPFWQNSLMNILTSDIQSFSHGSHSKTKPMIRLMPPTRSFPKGLKMFRHDLQSTGGMNGC